MFMRSPFLSLAVAILSANSRAIAPWLFLALKPLSLPEDRMTEMTDIYDPNLFDDPNTLVGDEKLVVNRPICSQKQDKPHSHITRANYVWQYSRLPQQVICDHFNLEYTESLPMTELLPKDAVEMLDETKKHYLGVAYWLAYYLLTKEEIETEFNIDYHSLECLLFHTNLITFKQAAEDELATLKLIKEYRPKSWWAQTFNDCEHLWFSIARSICWKDLSETNILGNGQPVEIGKTEYVRKARRIDKKFKNNTVTCSKAGAANTNWAQNLETLFVFDAALIANDDDYFRENYWEPYFGRRTQVWNEFEDNEQIQREWITPSGTKFVTGNGKRIPKQRPEEIKHTLSTKGRPIGSRNKKNVKKY